MLLALAHTKFSFFENRNKFISDILHVRAIILAGDCNCCLNHNVDRNHSEPHPLSAEALWPDSITGIYILLHSLTITTSLSLPLSISVTGTLTRSQFHSEEITVHITIQSSNPALLPTVHQKHHKWNEEKDQLPWTRNPKAIQINKWGERNCWNIEATIILWKRWMIKETKVQWCESGSLFFSLEKKIREKKSLTHLKNGQ